MADFDEPLDWQATEFPPLDLNVNDDHLIDACRDCAALEVRVLALETGMTQLDSFKQDALNRLKALEDGLAVLQTWAEKASEKINDLQVAKAGLGLMQTHFGSVLSVDTPESDADSAKSVECERK